MKQVLVIEDDQSVACMAQSSMATNQKETLKQIGSIFDRPEVPRLLSAMEVQAAKRVRRSGARAMLAFMNSGYHFVSGN